MADEQTVGTSLDEAVKIGQKLAAENSAKEAEAQTTNDVETEEVVATVTPNKGGGDDTPAKK